MIVISTSTLTLTVVLQRQTVVSQFFQLDRLVVEGGVSVSASTLRPIIYADGSLARAGRFLSMLGLTWATGQTNR